MDRSDVEKVALLARLELSGSELETLTRELGKVLDYVAMLDELDTTDVEPMVHAIELANVFREDRDAESLSREDALTNAPKSGGGFFVVPQILDGG